MGTNSDSPSLKIITNNVDEDDPERHNQQSNWIDKDNEKGTNNILR